MIKVPRHTGELFDGTPGPWWMPTKVTDADIPRNEDEMKPRLSAFVKCPKGHIAGIRTHTIHDDGRVDPSVVCDGDGVDAKPCDWHEFITLEGWSDRANALL